MRLVKFAVNNYRGITGGLENNSINLESSNAIFIFGRNNVGKSSLLRAYNAFYYDDIKKDDFNYAAKDDIVVEIWLKIDEKKDKQPINDGTGNKYIYLKDNYLNEKNILKIRKIWKISDEGKKPEDHTFNAKSDGWEQKAYGGIGLPTVFQPLLMTPLFIKAMPTEPEVKTVVTEVLKEAAAMKLSKAGRKALNDAEAVIAKLQDEIYKKDVIEAYKKDVNKRFSSLFKGYEIDIDEGTSRAKFTTDKVGKDFEVTFKDSKNQLTNYDRMGHGAVRMAIFLLMLLRDKLHGEEGVEKNFLVLFEEPELFLHPSLTKKLRDLIYDVSANDMPFQVLCASHSPQMIDLSKDHTSLVRMTKNNDDNSKTSLYQIVREDLKNPEQSTDDEIKEKIYEILRFDPFVCESFYADEVVLVEGDTEAIIWRGYQQNPGFKDKELFVVNCHSGNNIPFYQKIFSKFNIPYSVICDTDHKTDGKNNKNGWDEKTVSPSFGSGVQKTISVQFVEDSKNGIGKHFFVFPETFEPVHQRLEDPFKYDNSGNEGKPFRADRYWKQIVEHQNDKDFKKVPIISFIEKIIK